MLFLTKVSLIVPFHYYALVLSMNHTHLQGHDLYLLDLTVHLEIIPEEGQNATYLSEKNISPISVSSFPDMELFHARIWATVLH